MTMKSMMILLATAMGAVVVAASAVRLPQEWKHADRSYQFLFPRDHASHPEYRIEWWYYTGNLAAASGRRFGYQVTFFRVGIEAAPASPSRWAVRDLFVTHLAVTDIDRRKHLASERLNRAGIGWAGAATDSYRVWNDGWQASLSGGRHQLRARDRDFGVDLVLDEDTPAVLHGDAGFSRKGAQQGNASHYYSLTRMPTRGTLIVDGQPLTVSGSSWMDHEFGTTLLEPDQAGWDWFSMQLDDGTDLMVFQLRGKDGSIDSQSSGTLVLRSRRTMPLRREDFALVPGRTWTSPVSGAAYPVEWEVRVPHEGLVLRVRPAVDAQELAALSTGVTYWEGAITIAGTRAGAPIAGRGYLEMTGYTGRPMGEVLR